jgi:hypothetical protein
MKDKNTITLTDLEVLVLEQLFESADGNGHDFGFIEDIELDSKTARGVVSSLIKKDIISVHDKYNNYTQFTWNHAGDMHGVYPECIAHVLPPNVHLPYKGDK